MQLSAKGKLVILHNQYAIKQVYVTDGIKLISNRRAIFDTEKKAMATHSVDSYLANLSKVDSVFRMRSLGVPAPGLPDQYADGKAAKVWHLYIGGQEKRTSQYRDWFINKLREYKCNTILDVACGTGVDSIMLVEQGFIVTSTDASDKMLKYALKERWNRRKEPAFDNWVIEEANWVSLVSDANALGLPSSYDAVMCLGNSFAHLPDFEGDQSAHLLALTNFAQLVKPGGILIIDHRNYDAILSKGSVPARNVYYSSDHVKDIRVSNLFVGGKPSLVTLDYYMNVCESAQSTHGSDTLHFRLSYYPHQVEPFKNLLIKAFDGKCEHEVYGDFKSCSPGDEPAYFIHVVRKLPADSA